MIYKLWTVCAMELASFQRLIPECKSYVVDEKRHCVANRNIEPSWVYLDPTGDLPRLQQTS